MSRHQFGKKLEEKVFQTVYSNALRQERVHAFEGSFHVGGMGEGGIVV